MTPPKAVVFDLGKVLLDFDYSKAASSIAPHCPQDAPSIQELIDHSPLLFEFETGLLSPQAFFEKARAASGFSRELAHFRQCFSDVFTPVDSMIDAQRALKRKGIPTYIFSNTNAWAIDHIRKEYPFFNDFDGYVLSYEHGSMKPDEKIYSAVETLTDLRGQDLLYIDDREENFAAGLARGWNAIHHTDPHATLQRLQHLFQLI